MIIAYKHTLESVPGSNQYRAMNVKFLAKESPAHP
jgi:hypothetical protein